MRLRFTMTVWVVALLLALAPACGRGGTQKSAALVDLNSANVPELLKLPGMTETWALRIVRFRPYRSKLDLLNEGVISPEVYERIRAAVVAHRTTTGDVGAGKNH